MAEFGEDFDILRWTTGERDSEGHIIWHERYPNNNEWERVSVVTLDFNPQGDFRVPRNIRVSPDQPLDPPGGHYDISDLAQFSLDLGTPPPSAFR